MREFDRVSRQIRQDLTQSPMIAGQQVWNIVVDAVFERQSTHGGAQGQRLQHFPEYFPHRKFGAVQHQLANIVLREIQHIVHQNQQTHGGRLHQLHVFALFRPQVGLEG